MRALLNQFPSRAHLNQFRHAYASVRHAINGLYKNALKGCHNFSILLEKTTSLI